MTCSIYDLQYQIEELEKERDEYEEKYQICQDKLEELEKQFNDLFLLARNIQQKSLMSQRDFICDLLDLPHTATNDEILQTLKEKILKS